MFADKKKIAMEEALYDPVEDDENESWLHKRNHSKAGCKKALTCPGCFNQLAHCYTPCEDGYSAVRVVDVVVRENKIIRNPNSTLKMAMVGSLDEQARLLKSREQDINVKILCECECGVDVGYYDVNGQLYVLTNVI